jgi:hypothetical protein
MNRRFSPFGFQGFDQGQSIGTEQPIGDLYALMMRAPIGQRVAGRQAVPCCAEHAGIGMDDPEAWCQVYVKLKVLLLENTQPLP